MSAPVPSRKPVALLTDRNFGPFVFGKFVSSCGIWIQNLAAAVVTYELTGSALAVGFVSFLQFLPPLVLTLWTGQLADRYSRRALLMIGRMTSGSAVLVLGGLVQTGAVSGDTLQTAVYSLVTVMGLGLAISAPSMQAIVPGLVPKRDLEAAVTLGAAAPSFARAIGPAIGALTLFSLGPGFAFLLAGAGHLIFATALAMIRTTPVVRSSAPVSLFGGLHYARERPRVALLIAGVALIAFGSDPVITLTPSLATALRSGPEAVGVLTTMFGLGAIAQAFVIRPIRQRVDLRTTSLLGFLSLVSGLLLLAAARTLPIASAGFFLSGLGFMLANVSLTTRLHELVDDAFRGRVLALWSIAFLGARPIVALTNGFVADRFGLTPGFIVAAVVIAAAVPFVHRAYRDDSPG